MPIALVNIGNGTAPLSLMFTLSWASSISEVGTSWTGDHIHKTTLDAELSYTLRPAMKGRGESLWITGRTMEISGRIANQGGDGELKGWSAGFIQTIHRSQRNARYEDGFNRLMRLDTGAGLKDGDDGTIFYPGTEEAFDDNEVLKIELEDSPNFETPLKYGSNGKRLLETSGSDEFCSHLVMVRNKTIVDLAKLRWVINWQGDVSWSSNDYRGVVWKPRQPTSYLTAEISQNSTLYADLDKNPIHTPFSLDLNEAEDYCEIQDGGQWKRCNFRGDQDKGKNPSCRSWRQNFGS